MRLTYILSGLLFMTPVMAQDKTQYLLHEIPQTISLNPAITYNCKNYIELPIISQFQAYYRNSGFTHKQAFEHSNGSSEDSIRINMDGLANALGNRNHIRLGGKVSLIGFGFASNDWFFSLNVSNRSSVRVSFNRDIIDARDGNWDLSTDLPREINLNGTGAHLSNFTEFAFGAGYKIHQGFSAGIRAKYLLGSAHLQTRRSNIGLITTDAPIELTGSSDLLIRGSLPVNIAINSNGFISGVESNLNSISDFTKLLFSWNHGFALDAGIIYNYSENLHFSASILDLGFIRWRKNVSIISQQESFVFQGIDLNNFFQSGTDLDFLRAFIDSVTNNFSLTSSDNPYTAMIPVRLLAGADYKLNKRIGLGAVFEGEIISNRIVPSITLTAIARPSEIITASVSYSVMDRGYNNIGFGIVVGNGPVQFYLISDHIPINYVRETDLGLFWPYNSRTMNFRTGLNIIFGCKNKEMNYRGRKWRGSCPAYN